MYYNYSLSVNGTREKHGDKYSEDYLTNLIVSKNWVYVVLYLAVWIHARCNFHKENER